MVSYSIDWAVVFATFIGPIFAVLITLWYQARSERRRVRADLFAVMMRTRRHPLDADFVGALNLVPIRFFKDAEVTRHYDQLMQTFEEIGAANPDDASRLARLNERVPDNVAYLLAEMSKAVGTPIEQLRILRGGYSPIGWAVNEQDALALRRSLNNVMSGNQPIRVVMEAAPPRTN